MGLIISRSTGGGSSGSTNLFLYKEQINNPITSTPLGDNSIVLGSGAQTGITGTNSIAIGEQSLSRIPGGIVQANGRFASSGDAQTGKYILRSHTVNNSETELFIDGTSGSQRLVLTDNTTWTFRGMVTGHRTDLNDGHAGFSFGGVIYRIAGNNTITFQGTPYIDVIARSNFSWGMKLYADTTNGSLKITCTGQSSKTIRWVAMIETVEVTN